MRALRVGLLLILALPAASAVEDGDVLFFAPFETSMDASIAAAEGAATVTGAPELVEGMRGKAALIDPESLLEYAFAGNVVPSEGTVMMWFRPEWPAEDEVFHYLFRATTGNDRGKALNALYLYKYGRWARLMLYTSNGELSGPQQGRTMAYKNDMSWEPGTWHHVAATWSSTLESTEMYLYFDGERIAAGGGQVFVPDEAPETFSIGGEIGSGTTAFDDVLVFGRPLLGGEIRAIYDSYQQGTVAEAPELPFVPQRELQLRPFVAFDPDRIVTLVDYRGARRDLAGAKGQVDLTIRGLAGSQSGSAPTDDGGIARIELDHAAIGAGEATITATLRGPGGGIVREGELLWVVTARPEWLGNQLGVTDEVLPPWTPVRASGDTVSVWGRDYRFDRSPLPAQITTQGEALLRAPIELRATSGGTVSSMSATPDPLTATDAVAGQQWRGAIGPLQATATTSVEFDGFMRVDLELSAQEAVDALEIIVPLREEAATLYHHAVGEWTDLSDAGGTGEVGWSKSLPFVPYVWLGNERGGVAWWCESPQGWHIAEQEQAVQLLHHDHGVDLRLRVIDTPTVLDEPLMLTFGFLATPVKPLPEGWRNWRPMFISAVDLDGFAARNTFYRPGCRNIGVLWSTHIGSFSYYPADPAEVARKVRLLKDDAGWETITSYYALNCAQTGTSDFTLLERDLRRDPYSEVASDTVCYGTVCQASSYADLLLWVVNETMEATGTDGIYLDCSSPRFCRSAEHGCAPGRWPLLATRDLQKRLYALVREKRGDAGFVYSHVSESVFMTTYAYSDVVLNGEQYNRKDLMTDLTLEKFRAEFLPQNLGVPVFLLPTLNKFQPSRDHEKMPGREFLAFPLLHDVISVASWMSRDSQQFLRSVQDAMCSFGVASAEFLPYWSNGEAIGLSNREALVTGYHRTDPTGLLLIAQAPTAEPLELEVTLQGELAGLQGLPARDALTGKALQWRGGKLVWPLPGREAQVVVIEQQ